MCKFCRNLKYQLKGIQDLSLCLGLKPLVGDPLPSEQGNAIAVSCSYGCLILSPWP